jgi:oligopeptide transport system permease protein
MEVITSNTCEGGAAKDAPRAEAAQLPGVSPSRDAWRRLRKNRAATFALAYLVLLMLAALATPLLPLQSPYRVNVARVLAAPVAPGFAVEEQADGARGAAPQAAGSNAPDRDFGDLNWLNRKLLSLRFAVWGQRSLTSVCGTDELGRDQLARLFWGARISLLVGLVATLVSVVIGVTYGAVSGYAGGWVDNLMMRIVDVLYSIPLIFVIIFLITFLGEPSIKQWLETRLGVDRMTVFFLMVGAVEWLTMARVVRGQVISLRNEPFVEGAQALGASHARIVFRHLVPNTLGAVIVYLTLTIPQVMLFEAFLSFLGLGVQAPNVSWGLLANQGFKVITPIKTFWWLILYPGLALGVTLMALNMLGDGLRDALDPRMRDR